MTESMEPERASSELSFEVLNQKIDEYSKLEERERPGRIERLSFWAAMLSAAVAVLVGPLIGGSAGLIVAKVGVYLEVILFVVSIGLMLRREWRRIARERVVFAEELERDFDDYQKYVEWLRTFPRSQVLQRLRYVRARKNLISERLALISGGIERLGLLPVLVALYLQFKEWEWGDWSAFSRVNMLGGVLLMALAVLYVASWMVIRLKTRLESMESLLSEVAEQTETCA